MSEQQNTALVESLYDAFGRGDVQTILNHLTPDVDWALEGPAIIPFAGKRKGIPQVMKFFEALGSTQKNQKLTVDAIVAQGDKVATFGRYAGTVIATGKNFDSPMAHLFKIRDGRVVSFVDMHDTAAVAEAYMSSSAAAR